MRVCWAVQSEEAPGSDFLAIFAVFFSCFGGFLHAYRVGLVVWYPVCSGLFNTHSLTHRE